MPGTSLLLAQDAKQAQELAEYAQRIQLTLDLQRAQANYSIDKLSQLHQTAQEQFEDYVQRTHLWVSRTDRNRTPQIQQAVEGQAASLRDSFTESLAAILQVSSDKIASSGTAPIHLPERQTITSYVDGIVEEKGDDEETTLAIVAAAFVVVVVLIAVLALFLIASGGIRV